MTPNRWTRPVPTPEPGADRDPAADPADPAGDAACAAVGPGACMRRLGVGVQTVQRPAELPFGASSAQSLL